MFGFLKIEGAFANEIAQIDEGFEETYVDEENFIKQNTGYLHDGQDRHINMMILDKSPKLSWLKDDSRIHAMTRSLMPGEYEFAGSDGSMFWCDTGWHADLYGAPLDQFHLKFSMYLEPLTHETGAIRLIPGTNHYNTGFAKRLRDTLDNVADVYGVPGNEIPSWTLTSNPGDLVLWNYRTIHASYGGAERRRLLSMSFRELVA